MKTLKLRDVVTGEASDLAATGVFVFVGFRPNTGIIEGHVDHDDMGYLLTDANMHTSDSRALCGGRRACAAHTTGDDGRGRRDDGGDRGREISQGARRRDPNEADHWDWGYTA